MWGEHINTQKGSVTILAILAMLILGVSTSVYLLSAGTGMGTGQNYGDAIAAQYAGEAGVTYVLGHAKQNTDKDTGKWTILPITTISLDSDNVNSPTFTVTTKPLTKTVTESDGTPFTGNYYQIISVGKSGNTTRTVEAYLTIPATEPPTPITTFDLMKDADYSGNEWSLNNKENYATAPANNYYQMLFKDTVYANDENHKDRNGDKGFTLNYNVNLVSTTSGHASDSGYGIYYLASGSAKNMSAYVVQYDPGLSPHQILVKKVIKDKKSTTQPWLNEVFGYKTDSFQGSTSTPPEWNDPIPNDDGTKTVTLKNINPTPGYSSNDLMTIPMDNVLKQLNALKINNTDKNTMDKQTHKITIDARPFTNPKNNKDYVVHTISIDGLEILKFIDRGNNGPILTSGSTGLRVWQAEAQFFNNTNDRKSGAVGSIKIRSWGKEK